MKRRGWFQVVACVPLLTIVLTCGSFAENLAYTFSINGKPVQPVHYSLNADPSVFAPGDVIYLGDKEFDIYVGDNALDYGGLYMTLGEERDCRFVTATASTSAAASRRSPRDSRVFLELPDGRRKIVGLKVSWTAIEPNEPTPGTSQGAKKQPSFDWISYNPLDSLSLEEIHGLWGIALIQWPAGIEQKLAHVDTERVCLAVDDRAGVGGQTGSFWGGPVFPPIPTKTRYLVVEESISPGLRDFSRFAQFRDLAFLKFQSFPSEPLDAGLICQNTSLRYLDISGCGIPNWHKLASLTELRFLNIGRCRDFDNLDFVKDMHHLRTLYMGLTKISSLSPLNNSDSIREIHAGMTLVRDLPQGALPSLRALNIVSSKVDAQTVDQFRQAHPACAVQCGWVDSLRTALRGTTRLRIRSGGTCHRIIEQEKTLAEITDTREIERVLKAIDIDESRSRGVCMCCGNPTFEFYAGDRLLAMVGYHHGERLRWAGGQWTADGELTNASRDFLMSWLSQHGVDGPRREVEESQKQQNEQMRRQGRFAELISPEILRAAREAERKVRPNNDPRGEKRAQAIADVFTEHEKDAQTSIELYLRVLGVTASTGDWTYFYCNRFILSRRDADAAGTDPCEHASGRSSLVRCGRARC